MTLLSLFLRGFVIVALTAANVVQVSRGHYSGALIVGFLISWTWYANAHSAAHEKAPGARFAYSAGAALGTVAGMALARLW